MVQLSRELSDIDTFEPTSHQLSCANCGEPLPANQRDEILTCELCGQGHKALSPPNSNTESEFERGDQVAVLWGERWWPAHIIDVLGAERWKIHYEGWAPTYDDIVGPPRIRPIDYVPGSSIIPPALEHKLKVKRANILSAIGIVLALVTGVAFLAFWALGDQVFNVHDKQLAEIEAAEFGAITGRVPGNAIDSRFLIQPGQQYYVKWGNGWYLGWVGDVITQNQVLIHYEGWGADQDEVVDRSRLRLVP